MAVDYRTLERQLCEDLQLNRRPVAIAFLDALPSGAAAFGGTVPSSCSFWRLASDGEILYTLPDNHHNCPIGAYTHNITIPPDRARELDDALGLMSSIGYIRLEEVAGIPRLPKAPGAIVYAPLGETPVDPDVVLFIGPPASVMLLQEAAIRAGVSAQLNALARPTCMVLPAALISGVTASTGCAGNRVYTGIDESNLYVAVPGRDLARLANEVHPIVAANAAMRQYHEDRRSRLAAV